MLWKKDNSELVLFMNKEVISNTTMNLMDSYLDSIWMSGACLTPAKLIINVLLILSHRIILFIELLLGYKFYVSFEYSFKFSIL